MKYTVGDRIRTPYGEGVIVGFELNEFATLTHVDYDPHEGRIICRLDQPNGWNWLLGHVGDYFAYRAHFERHDSRIGDDAPDHAIIEHSASPYRERVVVFNAEGDRVNEIRTHAR